MISLGLKPTDDDLKTAIKEVDEDGKTATNKLILPYKAESLLTWKLITWKLGSYGIGTLDQTDRTPFQHMLPTGTLKLVLAYR